MNNIVILLIGIVLLFGVILYFALQKNKEEQQKHPDDQVKNDDAAAREMIAVTAAPDFPTTHAPAAQNEEQTEMQEDPTHPIRTSKNKRAQTDKIDTVRMTRPRVDVIHFNVDFEPGLSVPGIIVPLKTNPMQVCEELNLPMPRPAIFISGGASGMSEEDMRLTQQIIGEGVGKFAEDHGVAVIDGGTESGVMKMIGDSRYNHKYTFPLIGCAPLAKVSYPGIENPGKEADLENGHSHFVLVQGSEWGDESEMIVQLTHLISGEGQFKTLGIVINGGKITRQDVYLATTRSLSIPLMVLEGSGRFADQLATAVRTGDTEESIVRAIVQRADIQVLDTNTGHEGMYQALKAHFGV